MGIRMLRPAALLAAILLLSGCVPGQPVVTPAPEPSSTPIFATDEDALAAATAAYAKYLAVSDEIAREGGVNPDRIIPFVSVLRLKNELKQYQALAASGHHQDGSTAFDGVTLQQVADNGEGESKITFYVCLDQSSTRLVDSKGTDLTPPGLDLRSPFEVSMTVSGKADHSLILEGMERWSGSGIC